jgi:hypothetical protein
MQHTKEVKRSDYSRASVCVYVCMCLRVCDNGMGRGGLLRGPPRRPRVFYWLLNPKGVCVVCVCMCV